MNRPEPTPSIVAALPIADLPPGEIGPPLEPEHETWDILGDWFDPHSSQGGYRRGSNKTRIDLDGAPAIEIARGVAHEHDRGFVTGRHEWQDYTVSCRVQQLQGFGHPNTDGPLNRDSRAGLVFHMATVRRHYFFGLESQQSLVLYRRMDEEWHELGRADVVPGDKAVTLTVQVRGDGIRAECPELGVCLEATDHLIPAGLTGFRALRACRLFDLNVSMTAGDKERNEARTEQSRMRTAELGKGVPDAEEAATIEIPDGCELVACKDFVEQGRNALLFRTPDGLRATDLMA